MIIRFLLLFGLLIGATVAPASAQGRFSVGLTAAPVYGRVSTRQTALVPTGTGNQFQPTELSSTANGVGYSVGLLATYAFGPKLSVSTGVWYQQMRFNNAFLVSPPVAGLADIRVKTDASMLRVPVLLNYKLLTSRLSPYVSVGGVVSWNQAFEFVDLSGAFVVPGNAASKPTYQALVGAGVAYQINPHLSLTVQPMAVLYQRASSTIAYSHYVNYQLLGQTQLRYTF